MMDAEADVEKPPTRALQAHVEKLLQTMEGELDKATLLTSDLAKVEAEQREDHWKAQQERNKDIQARV